MSHHSGQTPDSVLLIECGPRLRRLLKQILPTHTLTVVAADATARALQIASSAAPALVILNDSLPDGRGTAVLQQLRRINPDVAVIVVADPGSVEAARAAMELGVSDYVPGPLDRGNLERAVRMALAGRP